MKRPKAKTASRQTIEKALDKDKVDAENIKSILQGETPKPLKDFKPPQEENAIEAAAADAATGPREDVMEKADSAEMTVVPTDEETLKPQTLMVKRLTERSAVWALGDLNGNEIKNIAVLMAAEEPGDLLVNALNHLQELRVAKDAKSRRALEKIAEATGAMGEGQQRNPLLAQFDKFIRRAP
jgi:hypothetical protein